MIICSTVSVLQITCVVNNENTLVFTPCCVCSERAFSDVNTFNGFYFGQELFDFNLIIEITG